MSKFTEEFREVEALVGTLPDSLKKRTLQFINYELNRVYHEIEESRNDTDALNALHAQLVALNSITDIVVKLKN